jgi:hypothetical protein
MPAQQASALTAPSLVTLALLSLLLVAERVGLPGGWVRLFFLAIIALAILAVLWSSRTTQERVFLGRTPALGAVAGGLVLATLVTGTTTLLLPPASGPLWLAGIFGALVGAILAHSLARIGSRKAAAEAAGPAPGSDRAASLIHGLGLVLVGGVLMLAGTEAARLEIARLMTTGIREPTGAPIVPVQAMLLPPMLAFAAVLAGGVRASLLQAALLMLGTFAILGLLLLIGMAYFGPLPLPGQSETTTLAAITDARTRWSITFPLHFQRWPEWGAAFNNDGMKRFGLTALITAGVCLALSPVISVRRKSTTVVVAIGCILLPLAVIAIAGYAIEAAASAFIGSPVARPSAALVETSRLGLVAVCGANPGSPDAIRLACGVVPRDTAAFAWGQISLTPAYIATGLSAASGFSTTLNLSAGLLTAASHLVMVTLGLGLAAKGLGEHLLARNYRAAGLASLRLGLVRLSALVLALALAFLPPGWLILARDGQLAALATGSLIMLAYGLWVAMRKTASVAAAEPVTARPARSRATSMPSSETA